MNEKGCRSDSTSFSKALAMFATRFSLFSIRTPPHFQETSIDNAQEVILYF